MKPRIRRCANRTIWQVAVEGSSDAAKEILVQLVDFLKRGNMPHEFRLLLADALNDLEDRELLMSLPGIEHYVRRDKLPRELELMLADWIFRLVTSDPSILFRPRRAKGQRGRSPNDKALLKRRNIVRAILRIEGRCPEHLSESTCRLVAAELNTNTRDVERAWQERDEFLAIIKSYEMTPRTYVEYLEDLVEDLKEELERINLQHM